MSLSQTQKSLLVAAYYRGGHPGELGGANCDQVVTLSLYYTRGISFEECAERFSQKE